MANSTLFILVCIAIVSTLAFPHPGGDDIVTQPKPGEEYVFVQTSGSGARPIARKDKHQDEERPFETAHKLPPSVTYALNHDEPKETPHIKSKPQKREATPADPAAAPAGAIKLDVQKLLEKYKTELKTSTTAPKSTTKSSRRGNKRTKKEARDESVVTSPSPVLTTAATTLKKVDEDVPLVGSGSEKQRSRIQIKKAPNGQEYEYEYVYYYYDDDDDQKVTNAHDGPARDQLAKTSNRGRGTTVEKTSATPEANEVVPSSRGKTRGRQLSEEEVSEERLPANTRFPPRSRNLNTTPLPEEETKATRGRGRGRPTTEAAPSAATEEDNVSDETQGTRGRTRANVRRPSLELVDNASFNTHPGSEPSASSPSFPTDLPAGPVRFLGATPNESVDPPEPINNSDKVPETKKEDAVTEATETDGTTVMSAMDKVALDLYAILQGTQKLSGEDIELDSEENSTGSDVEVTTLEATTEQIVETTTPTTTTTTTTTTTPAPTTTTTTEAAPIGRGRFKGRGRKTTHAASTTEASHTETKPKSKFSRPSFSGRHRPSARTTPEPAVEQEHSKEEAKPASHSRPTLSRSRFGATRTRTRTTAAPAENNEETDSSTSAPSAARPSLTRPRASFNLRTRGRSTTAAPEDDTSPEETASSETVSTTVRNRRIQAGSAVRPLRPGPRINLTRGRPGQATTTTTEATEELAEGDEEQPKDTNAEASEEKEPEPTAAPVDNSPLSRLKNKHRVNVQARPKAAASAPVQVRRINPLIARRRPGQTTEATSSEVPLESVSTEAAAEEEDEDTDAPAVVSSTTTEEPRGLNKLLAGRRRLAIKPAAHH